MKSTILFISIIVCISQALRFAEYEDACGACLNNSPRNRFSCTECIDSESVVNFCGQNVGDKTQCPRGNRDFALCRNAFISDALIGTYQSNYYSMSAGDVCMIEIQNGLRNIFANLGFWKIWKDQNDLQFYKAQKYDETDDNQLEQINDAGTSQSMGKGESFFLFVVNPTIEERHFKL